MPTYANAPLVGTSALKLEEVPRLRLVHNARPNRLPSPHVPASLAPVRRRSAFPLVAGSVLMLVVVVCSFGLDVLRGDSRARLLDSLPTQTVHVAPGDTLWSLAEGCADGNELAVSEVVAWIRARNGLTTSALGVGQELIVPRPPMPAVL